MLSEAQLGNFRKSIHNRNRYKWNTFEILMFLKCQYTKWVIFFNVQFWIKMQNSSNLITTGTPKSDHLFSV